MNPRELVILLLGLAIVAVVLRGLYVALQARRGQIRLAIDKNIPKDVDLDALEMAELPSGGARVRRRDETAPTDNDSLEKATVRAARMNLAQPTAEPVPVLMDAVQINQARNTVQDEFEGETEGENEDDNSLHYDSDDVAEHHSDEEFEQPLPSDVADEVVPDYSDDVMDEDDRDDDADDREREHEEYENDSVFISSESSAPHATPIVDEDDWEDEDEDESDARADDDYQDASEEDDLDERYDDDYDDDYSDDEDDQDDYEERAIDDADEDDAEQYRARHQAYGEESAAETQHDDLEEDDYADSEDADDFDDYDDEEAFAEDEVEERAEPTLGSLDDELDEFSMTAGERIGYQDSSSGRAAASKQIAAEQDDDSASNKRSLFSAFAQWRQSSAERKAAAREEKAALKEEARREAERIQAAKREAAEREASEKQAREKAKRLAREQQEAETAQQRQAPEVQERAAPVQDPLLDYSVDDDEPSVHSPAPQKASRERAPERVPQQLHIDSFADDNLADEQYETDDYSDDQDDSIAAHNESQATGSQPSEVLVINVMAKKGYAFAGDDLMHTLITSGLKFGDMKIFHQRLGNQPKGPVIFSVANILNPGTFDLNSMDTFTTVGVSLFLALPSPINNLDGFEKMLSLAQQLCASLGGELRDDSRNLMTKQTIEHYRQRVRDFELRQLKAAGSRG
jgi:cell division protein ZipA